MKSLLDECTDPHFNMALDQWGLEHLGVPGDDSCVSKGETFIWLWRNRPSVIVGANQNVYSEVNLSYLEDNGITLARRTTGGGAVYHDLQNLNYSIVGKTETLGDGSQCVGTIAEALRKLGAAAEVSGRNDILVGGRKVSGFARRNWKDRVMVHGTLMYDVDIDTLTKVLDTPGSKLRTKGVESVRSRVANLKDWIPGGIEKFSESLLDLLATGPAKPLEETQLAEVNELADKKFSTWEWIYGHSRQTGIERKAKLPCGNVTLRMNVDRGLITDCSFEGDFLGMRPASEFAAMLISSRYDRNSISKILSDLPVRDFFSDTDADGILTLLEL